MAASEQKLRYAAVVLLDAALLPGALVVLDPRKAAPGVTVTEGEVLGELRLPVVTARPSTAGAAAAAPLLIAGGATGGASGSAATADAGASSAAPAVVGFRKVPLRAPVSGVLLRASPAALHSAVCSAESSCTGPNSGGGAAAAAAPGAPGLPPPSVALAGPGAAPFSPTPVTAGGGASSGVAGAAATAPLSSVPLPPLDALCAAVRSHPRVVLASSLPLPDDGLAPPPAAGTGPLQPVSCLQGAIKLCTHDAVSGGGLCTLCGVDTRREGRRTAAAAAAAKAAAGGGAMRSYKSSAGVVVTLTDDVAAASDARKAAALRRARKLVLVLDLDKTLLHATVDGELGALAEADTAGVPGPRAPAPEPVLFRFGTPLHTIKARPEVHAFLAAAARRFELHVDTAATRPYALAVAAALDPTGALFGSRIVAQSDTGAGGRHKRLTAWEHRSLQDDGMLVILDDTERVWRGALSLVLCKPYLFWKDAAAGAGMAEDATGTAILVAPSHQAAGARGSSGKPPAAAVPGAKEEGGAAATASPAASGGRDAFAAAAAAGAASDAVSLTASGYDEEAPPHLRHVAALLHDVHYVYYAWADAAAGVVRADDDGEGDSYDDGYGEDGPGSSPEPLAARRARLAPLLPPPQLLASSSSSSSSSPRRPAVPLPRTGDVVTALLRSKLRGVCVCLSGVFPMATQLEATPLFRRGVAFGAAFAEGPAAPEALPRSLAPPPAELAAAQRLLARLLGEEGAAAVSLASPSAAPVVAAAAGAAPPPLPPLPLPPLAAPHAAALLAATDASATAVSPAALRAQLAAALAQSPSSSPLLPLDVVEALVAPELAAALSSPPPVPASASSSPPPPPAVTTHLVARSLETAKAVEAARTLAAANCAVVAPGWLYDCLTRYKREPHAPYPVAASAIGEALARRAANPAPLAAARGEALLGAAVAALAAHPRFTRAALVAAAGAGGAATADGLAPAPPAKRPRLEEGATAAAAPGPAGGRSRSCSVSSVSSTASASSSVLGELEALLDAELAGTVG